MQWVSASAYTTQVLNRFEEVYESPFGDYFLFLDNEID